jgi:hypothetical protein
LYPATHAGPAEPVVTYRPLLFCALTVYQHTVFGQLQSFDAIIRSVSLDTTLRDERKSLVG